MPDSVPSGRVYMSRLGGTYPLEAAVRRGNTMTERTYIHPPVVTTTQPKLTLCPNASSAAHPRGPCPHHSRDSGEANAKCCGPPGSRKDGGGARQWKRKRRETAVLQPAPCWRWRPASALLVLSVVVCGGVGNERVTNIRGVGLRTQGGSMMPTPRRVGLSCFFPVA